jgi:hypothetical protein
VAAVRAQACTQAARPSGANQEGRDALDDAVSASFRGPSRAVMQGTLRDLRVPVQRIAEARVELKYIADNTGFRSDVSYVFGRVIKMKPGSSSGVPQADESSKGFNETEFRIRGQGSEITDRSGCEARKLTRKKAQAPAT